MIPKLTQQETIKPVYRLFLKALVQAGFAGEIETTYASRLAVATDNSVYQWLPQAVVFPCNTTDVALLMRLSQDPQYCCVSFSARGGGTGTNGQSLNDGIIVDTSRHMTRILDLNVEERWVRVEAGLVKDQLNDFLRPHGLFFSPELSTSNRATIGGMVNTDASGQGSLVYGKTSDHVLEITAVLEDGSVLDCHAVSGAALKAKRDLQDREGEIYRQVWSTSRELRSEIEETFPQLNRFLTGYDLKQVYDPETEGLNLARLLCGSEGTLGLVTEITLSLDPIPTCRNLVNVKYDSFEAALRTAPFMLQAEALSVETVDSKVLDLARQDIVWHSVRDLITDVPGKEVLGLNIVEFAGCDEVQIQHRVKALCTQLDDMITRGDRGVVGYQVCVDLSSVQAIYAMRKKAVGLLGNTSGKRKPVAFTEDTAVPPEHLADYINEFRALLDANNLAYGMFGHVDCGVLHVRPALDLCDPDDEILLRNISDQVVTLTAKYGGLMWGEHGRGFRSEYGPEFFGPILFAELRKIKGAFDPHNRLNPGKICTPLDSSSSLVSVDAVKRGSIDRQIPAATRDSFNAALDCNGNGLCFNYETSSPMCPSFKQTGDRRHSPKGRAALMREWLRLLEVAGVKVLAEEKAIEQGGISLKEHIHKVYNSLQKHNGRYDFSHEVMEAMQGCLACKACSSQCPVKVDVPDFRARFMQLYYQRYLRPAQDYLVSLVENYAPLMAKAPALFNFFLKCRWIQKITEWTVGMVDVPLLSYPNLQKKLSGHVATRFEWEELERLSPEERKKYVFVVQDPFTSYYDAEVVADLVLLIEKLGYHPRLVPFVPNGKPKHIKGFLRSFKKTAVKSADFLNRVQKLGIPMIGPDPAMVLCYRDEYAQVLAENRTDFNVLLIQEWLLSILDQVPSHPSSTQKFYLFGHCTEKTAIPSTHDDWSRIFHHFGASLEPLAVGCCGMAGTYGHAAKNLTDSRDIYAMSWQPALANLPEQQCLVSGYSCRSQVKRIDGKRLHHPLQALLGFFAE
ncbi:FAD/FMN-containing dehydrogenase [Desulfuromusa kysingii]|uniref:D-2-hydroxyglutarate dehydrogenase n=1 Tax=Desulfuromusa kysingii TaxID=37625 RepID=A0A1H3YBR4_9BACT|nr:FAD-binding and (Fe-S)-binding domain-containing protein [Desulfuromusa kysingii]SEA08963.1 FAD/FMN-containing dehydrogenase [Desulfuromusa kysingii]